MAPSGWLLQPVAGPGDCLAGAGRVDWNDDAVAGGDASLARMAGERRQSQYRVSLSQSG